MEKKYSWHDQGLWLIETLVTLIEIGGKGKTMRRNFRVCPHCRDQGLIGIKMLI